MFGRFGDHPQGRERRNEEGEVAVRQVEGCGRSVVMYIHLGGDVTRVKKEEGKEEATVVDQSECHIHREEMKITYRTMYCQGKGAINEFATLRGALSAVHLTLLG